MRCVHDRAKTTQSRRYIESLSLNDMFIVLSDNSDVRSCGNLETEHAVNVLGACIDRIGIQVSATRGDGLRGGPYDTPVSFNYYQSVVQSCKSTKVVNTAFPDGRDLVRMS